MSSSLRIWSILLSLASVAFRGLQLVLDVAKAVVDLLVRLRHRRHDASVLNAIHLLGVFDEVGWVLALHLFFVLLLLALLPLLLSWSLFQSSSLLFRSELKGSGTDRHETAFVLRVHRLAALLQEVDHVALTLYAN